jgi:prepilin-type processing-associated H-X9-DG protein
MVNGLGILRSCPNWKTSHAYDAALADASGRTIGYGMTSRPWRDHPSYFNLGSNQSAPGNYRVIQPGNVTYRSKRIMVGDSGYRFVDSDTMPVNSWDDRRRHRGRANAVMFDGHVETLSPDDFLLAISNPKLRQ